MNIIGSDPGLKGAVGHYNTISKRLIMLDNDFDKQKFMTEIFFQKMMKLPPAQVAVLENVKINGGYAQTKDKAGSKGWSAAANATLQRGVGALGSVLNQVSESVVLVSPVTWKGQLFLTGDKQLSMDVAHLRFPEHKHLITRHDHAEAALLISWYLHGDETVEVEDD